MTQDRIKDLANKGFITQVETVENLEKLSEAELVAKGYITQTCVFDGVEETIEEVVEDISVVKDDEPEVDPDDAPLVDDEVNAENGTGDSMTEEELPE